MALKSRERERLEVVARCADQLQRGLAGLAAADLSLDADECAELAATLRQMRDYALARRLSGFVPEPQSLDAHRIKRPPLRIVM